MSEPTADSRKSLKLRIDAETRLREGSAPPSGGAATNADALNLLNALASAPASADDALKLLHELQVHQVELDLQHEQLQITRRELAEELARYRALYLFAPAGYFVIGGDSGIIEGNFAGADLLGVRQEDLPGLRIEGFLAPGSRPVLLETLKQVRESSSRVACEVTSGGDATVARQWRVVTGSAPGAGSLLMIVVDLGPPQAP